MSESTTDDAAIPEATVLDAGARRIFHKSWSELVADFARINKTPGADFTAAVLAAGALEMLKHEPSA